MRILHPIAVTVVAGLVIAVLPAPAGAAADRLIANWQMNESRDASTMADTSGNGFRGSIGDEVDTGMKVSGAVGYRFERLEPDTPPTHPEHLVNVKHNDALNPGTRDFAVTLRLRTTGKFGNIIQKGQATVAGGNFKLQIPNGIVQCLFRGSKGSMQVQTTKRLNDGKWHVVRCERTRAGLFIWADGKLVGQRRGWVGQIANSWPVTIGGKISCDQIKVGCDYYVGDLDWIELSAG